MTEEQVPAQSPEARDVIRVQHHHNSHCGECLSPWQTDAVVTHRPDLVGETVSSSGVGG